MSEPDLDALYAEAVSEAVTDDLLRSRFGVEPVADPSGLLQPAEPFPPDADEDAQFAAVMRRYYPGIAR
jgi:hypothetical protein